MRYTILDLFIKLILIFKIGGFLETSRMYNHSHYSLSVCLSSKSVPLSVSLKYSVGLQDLEVLSFKVSPYCVIYDGDTTSLGFSAISDYPVCI